jgi:hypothetical protein
MRCAAKSYSASHLGLDTILGESLISTELSPEEAYSWDLCIAYSYENSLLIPGNIYHVQNELKQTKQNKMKMYTYRGQTTEGLSQCSFVVPWRGQERVS